MTNKYTTHPSEFSSTVATSTLVSLLLTLLWIFRDWTGFSSKGIELELELEVETELEVGLEVGVSAVSVASNSTVTTVVPSLQ